MFLFEGASTFNSMVPFLISLPRLGSYRVWFINPREYNLSFFVLLRFPLGNSLEIRAHSLIAWIQDIEVSWLAGWLEADLGVVYLYQGDRDYTLVGWLLLAGFICYWVGMSLYDQNKFDTVVLESES